MARRGWGIGKSDRGRYCEATKQLVYADIKAHGWKLRPNFLEWLMGWPIGWSALEPLATGKFQQWLASHGRR